MKLWTITHCPAGLLIPVSYKSKKSVVGWGIFGWQRIKQHNSSIIPETSWNSSVNKNFRAVWGVMNYFSILSQIWTNKMVALGEVPFIMCLFQVEVLSPLIPVCERFKEQYKSFAVSLDATRHELPIKNIHIEGDTQTYLGMKTRYTKFTFRNSVFLVC